MGIECLLSDSPDSARELATRLDMLNQERKSIESAMRDKAFLELEKIKLDKNGGGIPVAVCLYDEQWHQDVIGILAARI